MRRAVVVAVGIWLALAGLARANDFRVDMQGNREPGTAGDPDGRGFACVDVDGKTVRYFMLVKDIDAPTAAHIHAGRVGENGSVVIDLSPAFTSPADGVYEAAGAVTVDQALVDAVLRAPGGYYVNVHNASFPGGALRGQLLGSGPAAAALATDLKGNREASGVGDPEGRGFGAVFVDGASLYYYLSVVDIAAPTAAHIHSGRAGVNGPVLVGLSPTFSDGIAFGMVTADAATLAGILADPAGFYLNVHNADYPGGAIRGQLGPTETVLHFPVVARNAGAGTSNFKTNVRILGLADEDQTVYAEWYPKNTAGLLGPAATVPVVVTLGGEAVLDDIVGTLFGANDRGALRLVSLSPFQAVGNTFNDQRANGGGTFGQFTEALPLERAATSGALLMGSNRPKADLTDFRTNLGYFNPLPLPVDLTLSVRKPDGSLVGSATQRTLAPFANDVVLYYQLATGVPADQRTQPNFLITYTASQPVFIFSSVVDNKTDDGLQQPALPVPPPTPTPPPNQPPDATITSPAGDTSIRAGESVSFAGTASDPNGEPVTVLWDFGDGTTATVLSPGAHSYASAGSFTVTLTATDARGLADPTPASVVITVGTNGAPNGTITAPADNVTTTIGQEVTFTGATSDPDGDAVTVVWDFGDGATSNALSTSHTYAAGGTYTVTFTATDAKGLADPTPDSRTVTVTAANNAPNGIIVTPAGNVTTTTGQAISFAGSASDPDGDAVTVVWDFGDGVSSTAMSTSHSYLTGGAYTVTFTVTDAHGLADPTPDTRTVTVNEGPGYTQVQAEIFTPICSGCHPPNQGMDLRPGSSYASIVNVASHEQSSLKRILPGDPDNSYLYRKVNGGPSISGSRMPQGGPFLSASQIKLLHDWILAGAPNS